MAAGGALKMSTRIAVVQFNQPIADNIFLMRFKPKEENMAKSAKIGQFVHIAIPDDHAMILRRPISINTVNVKDNTIDIVYQVVGSGTEKLAQLKQGDEIDALGPIGKGFDVALATEHALVVGGGVGVAPLLMLCEALKEKKVNVDSFFGFRSAGLVYQQKEFDALCDSLTIATEDGTLGHAGYVTSFVEATIKQSKPNIIYACGPTPLLKAIQVIALKHEVPCQLSLEQRMGCGIGSCLVCACKIKVGDGSTYKKVCKDGPVFKASEVMFDE
jgi:dihydroorotate dehydrogenase electron transfer subunit